MEVVLRTSVPDKQIVKAKVSILVDTPVELEFSQVGN